MDKFWMIVDINQSDEGFTHGPYDFILRSKARPKYCHADREDAEKELFPLKDKFPDGEFVLMEAVGGTRFSEVTYGKEMPRPYIYLEPITL